VGFGGVEFFAEVGELMKKNASIFGSDDGVFQASRERFGPKRKDGARKPRGVLGELAGEIWSLRDLKEKGVP